MSKQAVSRNDPLRLNVPPVAWQYPNINIGSRTLVNPQRVPGENTKYIVLLGQSLMANYAQGPFTPVNSRIHNLTIMDGGVYTTLASALGTDGLIETCPAVRIADRMITGGKAQRVIYVSIAAGGSDVAQWGHQGVFNQRIDMCMRRLDSIQAKPDAILWQQGTTDNSLNTTAEVYQFYGQQMIDTWRALGATCPIFIGQESWVSGDLDYAVRAGQAALWNAAAKVYPGADADTITGRYDAAHLTSAGCDLQSQLWYTAIAPYI